MDLFLDETKGWVIKSSHAFTVGLFHLDFLLPPPLHTQTHTPPPPPHLSWYAITNVSASTFLFLLLQLSLYSSGVCLN